MEDNFVVDNSHNEKQMSLTEIFILFKKYWLLICAVTLAFTIVGGVLSIILAKPKYTARATIMIAYIDDSTTATGEGNAYIYSQRLVSTFTGFVKTSAVQNDVIKYAKDNPNIETFYVGSLVVTTTEESLIVNLAYTTVSGKEQAAATLNQVVQSIMNVANSTEVRDGIETKKFKFFHQNIEPIDYASVGRVAVSKNWQIYVLGMFAVGFVLSCAFVIIRSFLDDTIKSKSDLERITGFNAIAFIEDIDSGK